MATILALGFISVIYVVNPSAVDRYWLLAFILFGSGIAVDRFIYRYVTTEIKAIRTHLALLSVIIIDMHKDICGMGAEFTGTAVDILKLLEVMYQETGLKEKEIDI